MVIETYTSSLGELFGDNSNWDVEMLRDDRTDMICAELYAGEKVVMTATNIWTIDEMTSGWDLELDEPYIILETYGVNI